MASSQSEQRRRAGAGRPFSEGFRSLAPFLVAIVGTVGATGLAVLVTSVGGSWTAANSVID